MMDTLSYRNAFIAALLLHLSLAVMLLWESSNPRPVLTASTITDPHPSEMSASPTVETIKAVSVDSQEVMKTMNRLKEERLHQAQAEEKRQRELTMQADSARRERVAEQRRLEKLKSDAAKLAVLHEKKLAEEKRRLQDLEKQKILQEKNLADMKNQQIQLQKQHQQEALKLAELKKEKTTELAAKEAKDKEALAQKQQAAARQAALDAEKNARVAGIVDKYKALIIGAISRQWILPENVDSHLSSQFRIRLAPNGAVLEVSLTRSSGDAILDRSAQSAIYKASPLPVPSDADTFNLFRDISLTVRPESARG